MEDPYGRSEERLRAHYELERELAARLRDADREERLRLYGPVYDELFSRLPDHPQHTNKATPAERREALDRQGALISDFVSSDATFMEIGAGDCALSFTMAPKVRHVYAVDVSEQITAAESTPENFDLVLTNGLDIPVPPGSVTVAYSNQLMEHLHPEDAEEQLRNVVTALAPGGAYICLTPHAYLGPHDVSRHFDESPTGFHLHEYTNRELVRVMRQVGFTRVRVIATALGRRAYLPAWPFVLIESLARLLPSSRRRGRVLRKLISPGGGVVAERPR